MRYGILIGTIVSVIIFILDAKAEKEKENLRNHENIDEHLNSTGCINRSEDEESNMNK
ncbi:MAG: hypothetical protein J6O73_11675 [Lachnospiraceae bacterium]|nr:hypothetical protein [Lachnospiraceae bacterium]